MKWVFRFLLSLFGALFVTVLLIVGVIAYDGAFGAKASDFTNMTFTAQDGTEIAAYYAQPEEAGTYPAVIMVHEWWGINEEITELADALAEEGYIVLAPDTYRGNTTDLIPRALYLRLTVDMERVDSDMQAAYDYLASLDDVDASNIGVIGFCYGGGVALQFGTQNPDLAAIVNLYGSTPSDSSTFGVLLNEGASPVLGIFGREDTAIPVEEVEAFESALAEAGIEHTVTIYDDMGHAFVQPDVIEEEGAPRNAWLQILDFFEANLQDNQASS